VDVVTRARLAITSVRFGRRSLTVRGTLPAGVDAGRVRVIVSKRGTRLGSIRRVHANADRWRAIVRLPVRALRLRAYRITVRQLRAPGSAARQISHIVRRPARR
jgi:hypothetical protein